MSRAISTLVQAYNGFKTVHFFRKNPHPALFNAAFINHQLFNQSSSNWHRYYSSDSSRIKTLSEEDEQRLEEEISEWDQKETPLRRQRRSRRERSDFEETAEDGIDLREKRPAAILNSNDETECGESITDRLRRLSQTSPEEFQPSYDEEGVKLDKAKFRYRDTLNEYEARFNTNQRNRFRNPNFRPRRESEGGWGNQYYREFSTSSMSPRIEENMEDADDMRFVPTEKWSMNKLKKTIQDLVHEKKVKEAVDTLFGALSQGGFKYDQPEFAYIYNLCISSCGQVGYVQMAFRLFNDMKKRAIIPKPSTYTSLFNACANSTWEAEKNIERMDTLRELMAEKGIVLNQVHYHSMIKGYGRCGDIQTSFALVDEMITQGKIAPTTETFNFLIQACITDSLNGFRHVLVTWRKMQSLKIKPDYYSYNLLLRAVRECGIQLHKEDDGQKNRLENLSIPKKLWAKSGKYLSREKTELRLPAVITDEESNDMLNLICLNDSEKALNNISQYEETMTVESLPLTYEDVIKALSLPENRLAVLGGLRGLFSQMATDKVGPNLKTMAELAQIIDPADASDLIMLLKGYKIKADIDFFNLLIKRCYMRENPKQAKVLMSLLSEFNVSPNIMTWGVSAIGCKDWITTMTMLEEMDHAKIIPNIEIMGALLHNACNSYDPMFVLRVMEETRKREVFPDERFILKIEEFKKDVKRELVNFETGKEIEKKKLAYALKNNPTRFEDHWRKFLLRFDGYMKSTEMKQDVKNPWAQEFQKFQKHKTHSPQIDAENLDNADRYLNRKLSNRFKQPKQSKAQF